ncbi:Fructosamine/Ketosamine-3-kinase [Podospora fimiseda]|uniref:protein-ribulosamine 3-kinase n=1 Tax=Podospora fimiseda TaxID=252190 RepID=A0AAN7BHW1_9PEZI|nr:Fructosamine/Ketosamine-3-kinase [Podospora fimiseda]
MNGKIQIDPAVLLGKSPWADAFKIRARMKEGTEESFFVKVSVGHHGRESLRGEFEGTSAIYATVPDFSPIPIAWGPLQNALDAHFYLCKFYEFAKGVPKPSSFCKTLAQLHMAKNSPNGKFGFHCTTYNGDLPQDNTWHESWKVFFANGREDPRGKSRSRPSYTPLTPALETDGRKVKPSLIHGDLWCGNVGVVKETGEAVVYDPAAFWGHNEYELGNWRPKRNGFGQEHFDEYHLHIPRSEPVEDYDERNSLYALRFNLHAAALFPDNGAFLTMVIEEIKRLITKFSTGLQDSKFQ